MALRLGGATASTYTLGNADAGTRISAQVSYLDGQGTLEGPLTSAQTAAVVNVNDAPVGSATTVTTLQDTAYVFSSGDFGFSDPNDNPANNLLAVRIATLPTAGTLTDNGAPVVAGQFVNVADINTGRLAFTPDSGTNGAGYATFTFHVQNDGGGSDVDAIARAVTVNVNAPLLIGTGVIGLPNVTPPPDTGSPGPVGSATGPGDALFGDKSNDGQAGESDLAGVTGSSGESQLDQENASGMDAFNSITLTHPILLPDGQRGSHGPDNDDGCRTNRINPY